MKLLVEVVSWLEGRGISTALIGGGALAVHGIARATQDLDLLTVDTAILCTGSPRPYARSGAPRRCDLLR